MRSIKSILSTVSKTNISNAEYYKINEIYNVLCDISGEQIEVNDTILTPFYICDLGVLEIYDYELNIRLVDRPSEENYILTRTGKTSIDDVEREIQEKIRKCYLELVHPQKLLGVNMLMDYFEFIMSSSEIKKRINDYLHGFNEDNLFFEIY